MGPRVNALLSTLLSLVITLVTATTYLPPPPPVRCNSTGCTVDNYQGSWVDRTPCKASQALFPTSEADLFAAVALASKTRTKVKLVSKGSHSAPKLVCPGGHEGLLISTQFYNSLIRVNLSSLTVTAQAGVMLRPLLDTLAQYNLTLPHTPYWQGVSVAGMISTGAHGSSMWGKGSSLHDYVVGMRLILPASEAEGYARIVDLNDGDEDLDAARLSLGVLGAISHVTFQVEPMFKRSVRLEMRGDERLEDEILEFAREHEFGGLNWYPASGKAIFKVDDKVGTDSKGDGAYNLNLVEKKEVDYIERMRSALDASEESRNLDGICQEEARLMNFRYSSGDGLVNHGTTFTSYPVVGFNHKMQTSGGCDNPYELPIITPTSIHIRSHQCGHHNTHEDDTMHDCTHKDDDTMKQHHALLPKGGKLVTCSWNPLIKHLLTFDTAISIPTSKVKAAILEIKKLRDMDPRTMCSLAYIGGIWIRFLTTSSAYLGESSDSVVFEMMYYRAKDPLTPRLNQDLFEEIEQMLVYKFGGKPHWGKNRDLVFEGMDTRTLAMSKFLEVRQRFDPYGLFSSEWTDAILGLKSSPRGVQIFQDHCALEGLCVCKEDSHCHPTKGYFCRPGYAYKDARVCRYEEPIALI